MDSGKHRMGSAYTNSTIEAHPDADLTINDICIKIFKKQAEFIGGTTTPVPILHDSSNISLEQNTLFTAGFATRTPLHHPKIPVDIYNCIEFLFKQGEKEKHKFQPPDIRLYLLKAGTETFESEFGSNTIFTEYHNTTRGLTPIFHAAVIPEEYRIELAIGTLANKIKVKRKDDALPKLPIEMLRAQMMLSLQNDPVLAENPEEHAEIVNALLSINIGKDIPISRINTKTINNLPTAASAWDMPKRKAIVKAIQIIHKNNANEIPTIELNDQAQLADAENEDIITIYQREIILAAGEKEEEEEEVTTEEVSQEAFNEFDDESDDENN